MPLLRAEQGASRSVAALHGGMLAVGAVVAGYLATTASRRLGRRFVLSGGALVLAIGVVLLVSGGGLEVTLPGALLAGTGGSTALNATSPALADHHGPAGAAAISEANATAALVGILAPLALGASVAAGLGWRPALAVAALLGVVAFLVLRRLPDEPAFGRASAPPARRGAPLGRPFWAMLGVLSVGVGIEFSTVFWAGDLLQVRIGASPGVAAGAVTGFVAGMAAGRIAAGRLALRYAPARLLVLALAVAAGGWVALWTASGVLAALVGLFVAGLGMALLFPLSVTLLMEASGGRPDAASGAASAGAGLAIGSAPFALGALADWVGPHRGFLLVPVLLLAAAVLLTASGRLRGSRATPASPRGR